MGMDGTLGYGVGAMLSYIRWEWVMVVSRPGSSISGPLRGCLSPQLPELGLTVPSVLGLLILPGETQIWSASSSATLPALSCTEDT